MVTAKDVQGVMAMMPSFSTQNAGDLNATATIDVNNLQSSVDRMIKDGVDVITTTGSFGECYNLFWDEFKSLAAAAVEAVKNACRFSLGVRAPIHAKLSKDSSSCKTSAATERCSEFRTTMLSRRSLSRIFTVKSPRCFLSSAFSFTTTPLTTR